MVKKVIAVGILLCSFLVATMNFSVAINVTTLTDDVGDVGIDDFETGQFTEVSGKEYLDITKIVCSRDYRRVTIELTVDGEIMDKGDILIWQLVFDPDLLENYSDMSEEELTELIYELALQDWVQYTFDLLVYNSDIDDTKSYSIIYVNKEILIIEDELTLIRDGTSSVSDGTLTISFNLPSSKENISYINVIADEFSNGGEIDYMDYNGLSGEVDDPLGGSNNNGGNGDQDDSGSGLTIFISLIVILIIVGVAVVIFLIRR
jgi:hypothetical protein